MTGPTVDHLLGDDAEAFARWVDAPSGPLAAVGPPFSGRESVLDAAAARLDATRLGPGDDLRDATGPAVVAGCHRRYERRVGGFDRLDRLRDALARTDAPVVTGWTTHAWEYLAATRDLDRDLATVVRVGPLDAAALADALVGDDPPRFVPDDPDDGGVVTVRRRAVEWRGRTREVPVPGVDRAALAAALRGGDPDPRRAAFDRLADASGGNLGVAATLWARTGDPVRPSDVPTAGPDRDLDADEAFCLRLLLATERAPRRDLGAVVGDDGRSVDRLARAGLVTTEGETVALAPAGVPVGTAAAARRRLL